MRPEAFRGQGPLTIKNWWWEEGVKVTPEMKVAVDEGLERFAEYLQADGIVRPAGLTSSFFSPL
jgi:hypothetical protein